MPQTCVELVGRCPLAPGTFAVIVTTQYVILASVVSPATVVYNKVTYFAPGVLISADNAGPGIVPNAIASVSSSMTTK